MSSSDDEHTPAWGGPVPAAKPAVSSASGSDGAAGGSPERGPPGTGGLTLEPPSEDLGHAGSIGFAPDLIEGAGLEVHPTLPPLEPEGETATAAERYPLAVATLHRLLGREAETAPADAEEGAPVDQRGEDRPEPSARTGPAEMATDEVGNLVIGPPITHQRPEVRRPPPPVEEPTSDDSGLPSSPSDDMLEMVLMGGQEGEPPSVHLKFKEGVLGGLFLQLDRTDEGLFARFRVKDQGDRRLVEGHVDMLLSRLRDRGLKVAGHEFVVGDR